MWSRKLKLLRVYEKQPAKEIDPRLYLVTAKMRPTRSFWQLMLLLAGCLQTAESTPSVKCPQLCNCSKKMYKVVCTGLDAVPIHLPANITHLEITHGTIKHVPEDYFADQDSMFTLKMSSNQISTKFKLPRNVKDVNLENNKLNGSTLHGMFDGLTSINTLDLSSNPIGDNLIPGTLKSLKSLTSLNLDSCCISDLGKGAFEGLNLNNLKLRHNRLKRLSKSIFLGINSSMGLGLEISDCDLEEIEEGTFQDMAFVNSLLLNNNQLKRFPDLMGIGANLELLDLSNNLISDISGLSQSGLRAIIQLDLSNNKIETILAKHFENVSILNFVSLSNNLIRKIPAGIMKKSRNLIQLILQNNKIELIESGGFDGMTNLREIFLFNNKLSSLPDDLFSGMSLRNLYLNNNEFVNLTGRPFRGINKAKTLLYLFSNHIRQIDHGVLDDLGNETEVAVRCRSLVNLPLIDTSSLGKIICTPYNLPAILGMNKQVAKSLYTTGFRCTRVTSNNWECTICKSGTYGNGKRDTGCVKCPAGGFYQEEMGQTECKFCSNGTFVHPRFAPGQNPVQCKACPRGTQSNKHAGYRACFCLAGFYRIDRFGMCSQCPSKGLYCNNDYAVLAKGYYWTWTNLTSKQLYSDFIDNLNIESDKFIQSVWKYPGTLPKPHRCLRDSSCLGGLNSSCADGYQGPLCALCKTNYFERMSRCIRCPSKVRAGFEIAGVMVAFVVTLLVLLWGDKRRVLSGRSIADVILSCFKIIIGFYQVMAGLYTCFSNIEWPSSVIWIQKALRFVELSILEFAPLSCLSPKLSFNALQQFVLVLVSNAVVVVAFLLYLAIRIQQHRWSSGAVPRDIAERVADTKRSCIRNICVFLFATYPKTCTSIIQVLSINCIPLCSHDDNTHCTYYLRSDVSVQCQTPNYQIYSKVAFGLLVYPIGFPVVIGILVWYYLHKPSKRIISHQGVDLPQVTEENDRKASIVTSSSVDHNKSSFRSGLSVFYENYRPECWYWETVEISRKLVLISGLTLIGEHSRTQIGLGAIISAVFAVLYVHFHPIANPFENFLQIVALVAIFLNLGIGVMLKESDDVIPAAVNQRNDKEGVSVIMVIINSAVVVIVIVSCLKMVMKKLYKRFKSNNNKCGYAEFCQTCGTFCIGLLTPSKMANNNFLSPDDYHTRRNLLEESSGR